MKQTGPIMPWGDANAEFWMCFLVEAAKDIAGGLGFLPADLMNEGTLGTKNNTFRLSTVLKKKKEKLAQVEVSFKYKLYALLKARGVSVA